MEEVCVLRSVNVERYRGVLMNEAAIRARYYC